MSLFRITFTGVDEHTDLDRLWSIARRYPYAEFGVLYSISRAGKENRYPSLIWLDKFSKRFLEDPIQTALHICGTKVRHILNKTEAIPQPYSFERIQLNFHSQDGDRQLLQQLCQTYPDIIFITQHYKANEALHTEFIADNHCILFDSSGGRGISRKEWPKPLDFALCGYAGGLGPDNIEEQLSLIDAASNKKLYWIDMENKVRTDDKFDLDKVEQVLKVGTEYFNEQHII